MWRSNVEGAQCRRCCGAGKDGPHLLHDRREGPPALPPRLRAPQDGRGRERAVRRGPLRVVQGEAAVGARRQVDRAVRRRQLLALQKFCWAQPSGTGSPKQ